MFRARSSRVLRLLVSIGGVSLSASGPDLSALEEKVSRIVDRARGQVGVSLIHVESGATLAPSDIGACCALSRRHMRGGVTITAGELFELMIVESDNTASDAVLKLVGGPAAVERRMRALGFTAINLNRYLRRVGRRRRREHLDEQHRRYELFLNDRDLALSSYVVSGFSRTVGRSA